jgi:BirA family biotin operon repressor/biotin-[acetyl-CoA-carboxylase] ligase
LAIEGGGASLNEGVCAVPIVVFDEIDSTNAEARRRAEAGDRGPVWLFAHAQTAGQGRRGRAWETGQGNLAATLLLTIDRAPAEAAQLSFVAALAVADLAALYAPAHLISLKWPNDPMLAGRKLSGILLESGPSQYGGQWMAVGIGVNLANPPAAPERPATALARHMPPPPPNPLTALDQLAEAFDRWFKLWLAEGFGPIAAAWTARAYGLGEPCVARIGSETVEGIAEGLDVDGALLLRLPDGLVRRIAAGDVFFASHS